MALIEDVFMSELLTTLLIFGFIGLVTMAGVGLIGLYIMDKSNNK